MNSSQQRVIGRIVRGKFGRGGDLPPAEHERWPQPVDEPEPERQTEIPADAQHDGRPPHMNPSKPG
jgi:hypothetical protein